MMSRLSSMTLTCTIAIGAPLAAVVPARADEVTQWNKLATDVAAAARAAAAESNQRRPGGEAVLERMSEMRFVEVLRHYVDGLTAGQTGWLAGMHDPAVGRVLALLHETPDAPWTLERLTDAAAMSRSMLHERFVHFIGQPPMPYLARWRMQVAATRLRETNAKIIEIALGVGYESEAAFSRAYKRAVGVAPGAWRAGRRALRWHIAFINRPLPSRPPASRPVRLGR
jgi:AraC-like DNA-binding protein